MKTQETTARLSFAQSIPDAIMDAYAAARRQGVPRWEAYESLRAGCPIAGREHPDGFPSLSKLDLEMKLAQALV